MTKKTRTFRVMTLLIVWVTFMMQNVAVSATSFEVVYPEIKENSTDIKSDDDTVVPASATVIESFSIDNKDVVYGDLQVMNLYLKNNGVSYDSVAITMDLVNKSPDDYTQPVILYFRKENNNHYILEHRIPLYRSGMYRVTSYDIRGTKDGKNFNESAEVQQGSSHPLGKATFTMGRRQDLSATLSVNKTTAKTGETVLYRLDFTNQDILDDEIILTLKSNSSSGGNWKDVVLKRTSATRFEGLLQIRPDMISETLIVNYIRSNRSLYYQNGISEIPIKGIESKVKVQTSFVPSDLQNATLKVLTPEITMGQEVKMSIEFNKDVNLFETIVHFHLMDNWLELVEPFTMKKINARKYEITVPSHALSFTTYDQIQNIKLTVGAVDDKGQSYRSTDATLKVKRWDKGLYSVSTKSIDKKNITINENGVIQLDYSSGVKPMIIKLTFTGRHTGANREINLTYENLNKELSNADRYSFLGNLKINPYDQEKIWDLDSVLTYFESGYKTYEYSEFTMMYNAMNAKSDFSSMNFHVVNPNANNTNRIQGIDRYSSAVELSKMTFTSADTAVLVSGMNFPDALAAGPLASSLNAPILLTRKTKLDIATMEEIRRLGVQKVMILGGENVISAEVERYLTDLMRVSVERIEGKSRFETAIETAEKLAGEGKIEKAVITNAFSFADSLAVGTYAAKEKLPILLTADKELNTDVKDLLLRHGTKEVLIMGGYAAVSSKVEEELKGMGITVTRVAGETRYLTAMEASKKFYPTAKHAVIASGESFADALAAVPYGAKNNIPIVLVRNSSISKSVSEYLKSTGIKEYDIIGGTAAISSMVERELRDLNIR